MSEEPTAHAPEHRATSIHADATICDCEAQAIAAIEVKRWLNQELPISRLPPELVLHIINIVRSSVPRTTFSWIRLSHIFHSWRRIAIDSSTLWKDIGLVPRQADMMREWLSRSQSAPLTVWSTSEYDDLVGSCDLVLSQGHRIEKLDVYLSINSLNRIRWSRLITSAALLQSVDLHVCIDWSSPPQPFLLPRELKHWIQSSSLVHLSLHHVFPLWNTSLFPPTLKELRLSHAQRWRVASLCGLDAIIADLNALPLLDALSVQNVLSESMTVESHRKQGFRPTHLRTFEVSDAASSLISFLDEVELPICCMHRRVDCWLDTASTWEDVIRSFIKLFSKGPPLPILSCAMLFEDADDWEIVFQMIIWRKIITISAEDEMDKSDDEFSLTAEDQESWDSLAIAALCQALPLQTIEVLFIAGYPSDHDARTSWTSFLFRETRRVRVMYLRPDLGQEFYVGDMLWALLATIRSEDTEEGPSIIFPELRELNLANYGFTTATSTENRQIAFWKLLLEALSFRRSANEKVVRLMLSNCTDVTIEHIERLKEVVDEVVWLCSDSGTFFHGSNELE